MSSSVAPQYTNPAYHAESLTPRIKLGLKALVSGAVLTQNDAADVAGVTAAYFSVIKSSPAGQRYMAEVDDKVNDRMIDTSKLLEKLGRESLDRMAQLMRFSDSESITFKAAQDLMDRSSETSKVQKLQIESLTMSNKDAKGLAEAMVMAADLRRQFAEAATGDFIKVDEAKSLEVIEP